MQRPRRTSEFHDEPGTATKRQSRQQLRATVGPSPATGTAQKYGTRKSRIAVPTRNSHSSSLDRGAVVSTNHGAPNSAIRCGRYTPQKTPLTKTTASRVLFTAERAAGGGLLHNDKKWVQEKMHLITEYLRNVSVPGISSDFFTRTHGLRQMSIKQFVAIVNYFLNLVWGTRFKVGTNHVDDISNFLQKLHYPYQVNKSWLKTPNTQHSFGNIIVMLDFLMDFIPVDSEEQNAEMELPLQESNEFGNNATNLGDDMQIPDVEFQSQMLRDSERGFMLWDKHMTQELTNLQKQTNDALILKRCRLPDAAALDDELQRLFKTRDELEQQRPVIPKKDEEHYAQLENDMKYTMQQLEMVRDDLETQGRELRQLLEQKQATREEVATLEDAIAEMKETIRKQIYTTDQRDRLIESVAQLRYIIQSQNRTIHDVKNREYHQAVQLSRAKMKLTNQVEKFNTYMRDLCYSQLHSNNVDDLLIPLHPEKIDMERPVAVLKALHERAQSEMQHACNELERLERKIHKIAQESDGTIKPKADALCAALNAAQKSADTYKQIVKQKRQAIDNELQELEALSLDVQSRILEYKEIVALKEEELRKAEAANEQTMSSAEQEYHGYADEREAFLDKYEATFQQLNGRMREVFEIFQQNQSLMEQLERENVK